eukprot:s56_g41.t1
MEMRIQAHLDAGSQTKVQHSFTDGYRQLSTTGFGEGSRLRRCKGPPSRENGKQLLRSATCRQGSWKAPRTEAPFSSSCGATNGWLGRRRLFVVLDSVQGLCVLRVCGSGWRGPGCSLDSDRSLELFNYPMYVES